MYCQNFNGKILKNKVDFPNSLLMRARCKSWACEYCARKNKEIWRASLIDQFNHSDALRGLDWSFVTVTVPAYVRKMKDATRRMELSARIIRQNWNGLMMAIKRHIGVKFEYIRVVEAHADGTLHVHMLMSAQWEGIVYRKKDNEPYSRWLARTARTHGFGYICSVRNLMKAEENEAYATFGALLYCLKYVTKFSSLAASLMNVERIRYIQTSRGIKSPETIRKQNSAPSSWVIALPISIAEYEHALATGKWFIDLDEQRAVRRSDFEDGMYPVPITDP